MKSLAYTVKAGAIPNPDNARATMCVPVYNGAAYLQACLESIARQTELHFVAVVVDNASTDATPEICAAFDDLRFFYVRNEHNLGSIGNHNRCLELVATDYAKLFSADDVLLPETLGHQVRVLDQNPDVGLVTCDCIVTGPILSPCGTTNYLQGWQPGRRAIAACDSRAANLIGGPSNTLLRSQAVGELRFDTRYKWLADLEINCRVLLKSNYMSIIDQPGFLYRRHDTTDSELKCRTSIRLNDDLAFVWRYKGGSIAIARGVRISCGAPLDVLLVLALALALALTLALVAVVNCAVSDAAISIYMRAQRQEPMLTISVITGCLTALCAYFGAQQSMRVMVLMYAAVITFVFLPWTAWLLSGYYRKSSYV